MSSIALGRAGLQFFFMDGSGPNASNGNGASGASSSRASSCSRSSRCRGHRRKEPLLYRLSQDQPQEVSCRVHARRLAASSFPSAGCLVASRCHSCASLLGFTASTLALRSLLQGLLFLSALAAFESRTLYANSSGDHLVG